MFVVLADTHGETGPRLSGGTRASVADAAAVVHAGDHTTPAALDGLRDVAGGPVHAVHGNADVDAVRDRLPEARVLDLGGVRTLVTHTHEGGRTGLAMRGRARGAALVVAGHTHCPAVTAGPPTVLNPGSHAAPRGGAPATHAELERVDGGLAGRIVAADGVVERFTVGRNG